MTHPPIRALVALLLLAVGGPSALTAPNRPMPAPAHLADADDAALVAEGRHVYRARCASCHGRALQGQPLWQLEDAFAGRRAPAHDETGHTWQHSDEDLFQMTKFGRFPDTPPDPPSAMPAFAGSASDTEILAALAFIKARWPIGLRVAQASLNPGQAGMPEAAAGADWALPTNCIMPAQRLQQAASKQRQAGGN